MAVAVQKHSLPPGWSWVDTPVPITNIFVLILGSLLQTPQGQNTKPSAEEPGGLFRLDSLPREPPSACRKPGMLLRVGKATVSHDSSACNPPSPLGSVIKSLGMSWFPYNWSPKALGCWVHRKKSA